MTPPIHDRRPSTRFSRRRAMALFVAAACPVCVARSVTAEEAHAAAPGAHAAPHWGYDGAEGPGHWGTISGDYHACSIGRQQTPVDLVEASPANAPGAVAPRWRNMAGRILNNGHTIQVNCAPGSTTTIGETRYDLLQYHFHHPSEHLLAGRHFDLECHFVHRAASGALAVLGVFVRPGAANAELEKVFAAMPASAGPEQPMAAMVSPIALLPADRGYFRYQGSLTTPPCTEGLTWTIYQTPIEASVSQIQRFAGLFANNARPAQARNGRHLLRVD